MGGAPQSQLRRQSQFNARKKFHYAIMCVRAMVRIKRLRYTLEPLKVEDAMCDPYRVKILRKVSEKTVVVIGQCRMLTVYILTRCIHTTGYRWLCIPRLRALGEKGRGPESRRPVREYAAHRTACHLSGQSQSMRGCWAGIIANAAKPHQVNRCCPLWKHKSTATARADY